MLSVLATVLVYLDVLSPRGDYNVYENDGDELVF